MMQIILHKPFYSKMTETKTIWHLVSSCHPSYCYCDKIAFSRQIGNGEERHTVCHNGHHSVYPCYTASVNCAADCAAPKSIDDIIDPRQPVGTTVAELVALPYKERELKRAMIWEGQLYEYALKHGILMHTRYDKHPVL